jgi:hypothetical protein
LTICGNFHTVASVIGSSVVYSGCALAVVALAVHSVVLAAAGGVLAVVGLLLPAPVLSAGSACLLDSVLPRYEFHERHSVTIRASAGDVMTAVRCVSADEIQLLRGLMWARSLGRSRLLGPRGSQPVIDAMVHSGFLSLAESEREVVFGAVGRFWSTGIVPVATAADYHAFAAAGCVKAATNFLIADESNGWCRLTTETRIAGIDATARRRFAAYWRLIYPGSALIRRMWLRAVARRAERTR